MPASYIDFYDVSNASVSQDSGYIRVVEVDDDGDVLTSGVDCMGRDFGSIYGMGALDRVSWMNDGSISTKMSLNGKVVASAFTEGDLTLSFDVIGYYALYTSGGGNLMSLERLIKSKRQFKMAWYDRIDATVSLYQKRVFWMARFVPKFGYERKLGDFVVIPVEVKMVECDKVGKTVDPYGVGGLYYHTRIVSSVQSIANETFEAQAEAS